MQFHRGWHARYLANKLRRENSPNKAIITCTTGFSLRGPRGRFMGKRLNGLAKSDIRGVLRMSECDSQESKGGG